MQLLPEIRECLTPRPNPLPVIAWLFEEDVTILKGEPVVLGLLKDTRVMPRAFAEKFAEGVGRLSGGAKAFVTAADDLADVRTIRQAQRRLALFKTPRERSQTLRVTSWCGSRCRIRYVSGCGRLDE